MQDGDQTTQGCSLGLDATAKKKQDMYVETSHDAVQTILIQSNLYRKKRSEALGVCAVYIISLVFTSCTSTAARLAASMQEEERERTECEPQYPVSLENPTFLDIAPTFAKGKHGKGYGKPCPRDRAMNCSVVDSFDQDGQGSAGKANHFLSWVSAPFCLCSSCSAL